MIHPERIRQAHFLRARRKKIGKIGARRKKDEAGQGEFVCDWERKKGGRR